MVRPQSALFAGVFLSYKGEKLDTRQKGSIGFLRKPSGDRPGRELLPGAAEAELTARVTLSLPPAGSIVLQAGFFPEAGGWRQGPQLFLSDALPAP